jgi:hypothetical protein
MEIVALLAQTMFCLQSWQYLHRLHQKKPSGALLKLISRRPVKRSNGHFSNRPLGWRVSLKNDVNGFIASCQEAAGVAIVKGKLWHLRLLPNNKSTSTGRLPISRVTLSIVVGHNDTNSRNGMPFVTQKIRWFGIQQLEVKTLPLLAKGFSSFLLRTWHGKTSWRESI